MNASPNDPTATVVEQHQGLLRSLPFDDRDDVEAADRGFLGALEPAVVRTDDGRVVWDNDAYGFLRGDAPETVNPSLWRQSALLTRQGLYEVVEGIYQVRGLDLSNVTFVEGDSGVIVIDPLISKETAAAALALYREHREHRDDRRPPLRHLRGTRPRLPILTPAARSRASIA